MPVLDYNIRLADTLEGLTVLATKEDGSLIDEDLTGASCKFSLKTWGGEMIADHVNATIVNVTTKQLGFDMNTIAGQLVASPVFYPHQGWFTVHIVTPTAQVLSVPNFRNLNIGVYPG